MDGTFVEENGIENTDSFVMNEMLTEVSATSNTTNDTVDDSFVSGYTSAGSEALDESMLETTFDRIDRLLQLESELKQSKLDSPITKTVKQLTRSIISSESSPKSATKLKSILHDQLVDLNSETESSPKQRIFKTPSNPLKPCKIPTLKNIYSPVAYYVKQSPSTPLVTKINPPCKKVLSTSTEKPIKKTIPSPGTNSLPKCSYKKASVKLVGENAPPNVHRSIGKYFPKVPTQCVIRHEGRFKKDGGAKVLPEVHCINDSVGIVLNQSDAIFNESSVSNVSIQIQKPAVRKYF